MELSPLAGVFLLTVMSAYSAAQFPEEDRVVVLTNETIDNALRQFPQLFIEFCSYSTDCGSLKRFEKTISN